MSSNLTALASQAAGIGRACNKKIAPPRILTRISVFLVHNENGKHDELEKLQRTVERSRT
jgi:hypothetical protein